ncbi:MAG: thiamine pyrophosphate-dependent dehydrogenase E1 component subunit alpha [Chloroflexi bacterium]|nr:thiamine pyrophosphate-dependent dehydrogenase E1 component subunit alpha [Chloroflexota bacterium]
MSSLSREKLLEMFTWLLRLRRMEEKCIELALSGMVPGWLHSYLGQEAVSVGVVLHLRREDYITGTHRSRGHDLVKGVDLKRYVAEILGRKDGPCFGRGGEMHLADKEVGAMGASGIVGGIVSTAVGLGFAAKYKGEDRVSVTFFGDGASNQGTFHECLNLATVWKLPVLFVCENNGWAEFSPQGKVMCVENVAARAAAYGLPGITVDGDDVEAVYQAAGEAIARIRHGDGPILLECKTHRWLGHYVGDPQKYRMPQEVEGVRQFDPLMRFESKLLKEGILTEEMIRETGEKVRHEVNEAIEFGKNSPFPEPQDMFKFVYAEEGAAK